MKKAESWFSVYLFDTCSLDLVLLDVVVPLLEQLETNFEIYRFFFIRYGEDGTHIRLRLLAREGDQDALGAFVKDYCQGLIARKSSFRYRFCPYIPESDRYGGIRFIGFAEQAFFASSYLALTYIKKLERAPVSARYVAAFKMHLLLFKTFGRGKKWALAICDAFVEDWGRTIVSGNQVVYEQLMEGFRRSFHGVSDALFNAVSEFIQGMEDGEMETDFVFFCQQLRLAANGYSVKSDRELVGILGSLMHMTHNRLGITNRDEPYVVYLLKNTLTHVYWK